MKNIKNNFASQLILCSTFILLNFSSSFSQSLTWQWAKSAGDFDNDFATCITKDASGNLYVGGYYGSTTITFGSFTLTNNSTYPSPDAYVAKYDTAGNVLWAKSFGGIYDEQITGIAIDANGNCYVTGAYGSPDLIFANDTLHNLGIDNIFLAKYDGSGNEIWARGPHDNYDKDGANGIAINAAGEIFIAGYFQSPFLIFNTDTMFLSDYADIFIAKYDTAGNFHWAKDDGKDGFEYVTGIALDKNSNIYITGYFGADSTHLGNITLYNSNLAFIDVFTAKYDSAAAIIWAKTVRGASSNDGASSIAVDASGNAYITGNFQSDTLFFDADTVTTTLGNQDIFIARYNTSGNVIWAKGIGGNNPDYPQNIMATPDYKVYVTGNFQSDTIAFDNDTLLNTSLTGNLFVAQYDTSGTADWAVSAHGSAYVQGNGVVADGNGACYVAGYFTGTNLDFGSTTLTNVTQNADVFVAKLSSDYPTGISETNIFSNSVLVYPNPASGHFFISSPTVLQNASLKIQNAFGQMVFEKSNINGNTFQFDISSCAVGIYFIELKEGASISRTKLIKN